MVHGGPGVEHSELIEPMSVLTEDHRVLWYDQRGSVRSPYSSPEQLESITFDAHVSDLSGWPKRSGLLPWWRTRSGP